MLTYIISRQNILSSLKQIQIIFFSIKAYEKIQQLYTYNIYFSILDNPKTNFYYLNQCKPQNAFPIC